MQVQAVTFQGYNSILKTAWKQNKLPTVQKGIYGKELTLNTISLEHIEPHSLGGQTVLDNLFLADMYENSKRGIKPIADVITYKQLFDYLTQFIGVKTKGFNGNDYIIRIMRKINQLGGLKQ